MFPVTGIEAHRLPPEFLGEPKADKQTIDLALLGQNPPDIYRIGPRDILGIWIEGVMGDKGQPPPVQFSEEGRPPALGYPVPVREDGTLTLPWVDPVFVKDMSLEEAEQAISEAYIEKNRILQEGRARVVVTLMQPRTYHVLVIRQETGNPYFPGSGVSPYSTKQGTGHPIDLPAYQNDVLNALSLTGGLPGLDAVNEIIIHRGVFKTPQQRHAIQQQVERQKEHPHNSGWTTPTASSRIRIPLRLGPDEQPSFGPEDVIVQTGDVVFIESRLEFFYTGGLLPAGEFPLPRDYDLDVITAMAQIGAPIANGGNRAGSSFVAAGVGDMSPSKLVILRQIGGRGQIPIRVDLNDALLDPSRRMLIQPGDILILQQTPGEAIARYLSQVLNLTATWELWNRGESSGFVFGGFPQGLLAPGVGVLR